MGLERFLEVRFPTGYAHTVEEMLDAGSGPLQFPENHLLLALWKTTHRGNSDQATVVTFINMKFTSFLHL